MDVSIMRQIKSNVKSVKHEITKKDNTMNTNQPADIRKDLIVQMLDVQNLNSLNLRKKARAEARAVKFIAMAEERQIREEGERQAEEILAIGKALGGTLEVQELKREQQRLREKRNEAGQLATMTEVTKLKTAFLEEMTMAVNGLFVIEEKIAELMEPLKEAQVEAKRIRLEAEKTACKVIQEAIEDPALKLDEEITSGLRKYFLRMIESGKTVEAINLAALEENMLLYREIQAAAEDKGNRMKAAKQVFRNGLPEQIAVPEKAAALLLIRDILIITTKNGQEIGRMSVDGEGRVIEKKPYSRYVWNLYGNNVTPLRPRAASARI
jgi:hypothetical protein